MKHAVKHIHFVECADMPTKWFVTPRGVAA